MAEAMDERHTSRSRKGLTARIRSALELDTRGPVKPHGTLTS